MAATRNWIGKATAVAQVDSCTLGGTWNAATVYTISIGDTGGTNYTSVSSVGEADEGATTDALAAAITASAHPFWSSVTAVSDSIDTITLTAAFEGFPFEYDVSYVISTGTITKNAQTTASAGPHHWDDPNNMLDGTLPTTSDTIIIAEGAVDILFGLDTNTNLLANFYHRLSFTGKIGLNANVFTIGEGIVDATVQEYRQTYLDVKAADIRIGQKDLESLTIGSGRTKINCTDTAGSEVHVYETAQVSSESNLPAVRLLANNADVDFNIHGGRAGVGIGVDPAGGTVTCGDIWVSQTAIGVNVSVGSAVTFTNWESHAGTHKINGTGTLVTTYGGTTECDADLTLATFTNEGATAIINGAIGTATNLNAGITDGSQNNAPRTWTATTLAQGATVKQSSATAPALANLTLPTNRFQLACT